MSKRILSLTGAAFTILAGALVLSACPSEAVKKSNAMWNPSAGKGEKRGCLPCHAYRLPIARSHNYRCDTCHGGMPFAKDKDVAHRDLFPHPQDEAVVAYTCQKCHNDQLGKDIPYDEEFVKEVLISHGDYAE